MKETLEHNGFTITLVPDDCAESPDTYGDGDIFLVAFHGSFTVSRDGFSREECSRGMGRESMKEYYLEVEGYSEEEADTASLSYFTESEYDMFKLNAYIHSGVSLSLGEFDCPWDSGQVGYVLVKKGSVPDPEKAALSLVSEWNKYLGGDVWCFEVTDSSGEVVSSGGGYYGLEDALNEVKTQHCPSKDDKKEAAVRVLLRNRTWIPLSTTVPLSVGVDEVAAWLMEHPHALEPIKVSDVEVIL